MLLDEQPMAQLPVGPHRVSLPQAGQPAADPRHLRARGSAVPRAAHRLVVFPPAARAVRRGRARCRACWSSRTAVRGVRRGGVGHRDGQALHEARVRAAGLEVGPYTVVHDRTWRTDPQGVRDRVAELGFPVFVKPARAGSSFGITRVDEPSQLDAAIATARKHDLKPRSRPASTAGRSSAPCWAGTARTRREPPARPRSRCTATPVRLRGQVRGVRRRQRSRAAWLPEDVIETLRRDRCARVQPPWTARGSLALRSS
ncbi:hypothetical protein QJS66_00795 [Kocuria rhizophila]|nr:hypothetical protein QJS66_00795 [Kocuria rhizophila]